MPRSSAWSGVGVDDSFFDLGGDSILSMQVVARARAAGVRCRPRDIFVEQTVARLGGVAKLAGGEAVIDEGIGAVDPTPIMQWLQDVPGRIDQFNQTLVIQAPAGVTQCDAEIVLQGTAGPARRALRLRAEVTDATGRTRTDGGGDWSLTVPDKGTVSASATCLTAVTRAARTKRWRVARARLNPADGAMVRAWGGRTPINLP